MTFVEMTMLSLYVVIAIFSLYMTHQERRWNPEVTPVYGLLGYVLCVFWPLTAVFLALTVAMQRRSA